MKKFLKRTGNALFITLVITAMYVVGFHSDWLVVPPNFLPKASALSSDKYDGDCTPTATVGRCADKCPAPTDQGVYFERGFDKDTGAAICGFSFYHECPYAEAVSADDPLCNKLGQEQQQTETDNAQMEAQYQADPSAFVGK